MQARRQEQGFFETGLEWKKAGIFCGHILIFPTSRRLAICERHTL
jgi:hypothetical protein